MTSEDHPDYSIIKISQNTEKSPGDLKRLEETWCLLDFSEKQSAKDGVIKSQKIKIIIIVSIQLHLQVNILTNV